MARWALDEAPVPMALVDAQRVIAENRAFEQLARRTTSASFERLGQEQSESESPSHGLVRLLVSEVAALKPAVNEPITRVYRHHDRNEYLEACYCPARRGESKRMVVMLREVTEHVRADRELARMRETLAPNERMRAIGELASGVAHDLNNTLHAMNLRLSLIEQSEACQTAQGGNIAALSRAINDAALVVGRLQDFARQKSDRTVDSIDLSTVVGEAVELVRTTIEGESSLAGAPVRIRTGLPLLPAVTALASELRHAVLNLLLNARDAMPEGGTIDVVGEVDGTRVTLKVLDEGCGIPEKDLEAIFSPFFTTKGTRGTGLGLSNARAVLAAMGAHISASNRATGGACFTLSFPIAEAGRGHSRERRQSEPPPGRRILIVDDNVDNLQATKLLMEMQQQSVDIAETGSEAIARLVAGARYDLVFCDLGMPDMSGWRIAREIQQIAPGTPVYMLTGWEHHIQDDDPRRQWVKGVLYKPMKAELMRDLLADEMIADSAR